MTFSERRQRFFTNLYWTLSERWVCLPGGWRMRILRWCNGMKDAHPFFSWRLLSWLSARNPKYCWTKMVLWKIYGDDDEGRDCRDWSTCGSCEEDCTKQGVCYCGKLMTPEYRAQMEAHRPDDLPF